MVDESGQRADAIRAFAKTIEPAAAPSSGGDSSSGGSTPAQIEEQKLEEIGGKIDTLAAKQNTIGLSRKEWNQVAEAVAEQEYYRQPGVQSQENEPDIIGNQIRARSSTAPKVLVGTKENPDLIYDPATKSSFTRDAWENKVKADNTQNFKTWYQKQSGGQEATPEQIDRFLDKGTFTYTKFAPTKKGPSVSGDEKIKTSKGLGPQKPPARKKDQPVTASILSRPSAFQVSVPAPGEKAPEPVSTLDMMGLGAMGSNFGTTTRLTPSSQERFNPSPIRGPMLTDAPTPGVFGRLESKAYEVFPGLAPEQFITPAERVGRMFGISIITSGPIGGVFGAGRGVAVSLATKAKASEKVFKAARGIELGVGGAFVGSQVVGIGLEARHGDTEKTLTNIAGLGGSLVGFSAGARAGGKAIDAFTKSNINPTGIIRSRGIKSPENPQKPAWLPGGKWATTPIGSKQSLKITSSNVRQIGIKTKGEVDPTHGGIFGEDFGLRIPAKEPKGLGELIKVSKDFGVKMPGRGSTKEPKGLGDSITVSKDFGVKMPGRGDALKTIDRNIGGGLLQKQKIIELPKLKVQTGQGPFFKRAKVKTMSSKKTSAITQTIQNEAQVRTPQTRGELLARSRNLEAGLFINQFSRVTPQKKLRRNQLNLGLEAFLFSPRERMADVGGIGVQQTSVFNQPTLLKSTLGTQTAQATPQKSIIKIPTVSIGGLLGTTTKRTRKPLIKTPPPPKKKSGMFAFNGDENGGNMLKLPRGGRKITGFDTFAGRLLGIKRRK